MRKLILLIFFTISCSAYGQDSTKTLQLGVDLSWGINDASGENYFPGITLSSNKHCVFAGPMLVNYVDPIQRGAMIGVQAGYQIYPYGRHKRFNLFFEYDFNYFKGKIVTDVPGPTSDPTGGVKRRTLGFYSLYNYFSYGFRLNIIKGLYFKTNVGLGLGWSKDGYSLEYWNGLSFNDNPVPAHFGLGGIIKAGLGFDIMKIKRK